MSDEKAVVPILMGEKGVAIHNIDELWRFSGFVAESGIAPKGMKQASIFAVVQSGAELGLTPFRALANMKVINGRVGPMGALGKALVRKSGVLAADTGFKEYFTGEVDTDEWTAWIATRRGEEGVISTSFSVKDAKRASLWGKDGPWKLYPKRMLMWRAVGFHLDDYYSDILLGFHIAEVLEDYPGERFPAVMEKLDEPVKDPLLDKLQKDAERENELKKVEKDIMKDAILMEGSEGKVDQETGEYKDQSITVSDEEAPPLSPEAQATLQDYLNKKKSPLQATMDDMTEREALENLKIEGEAISDEALDTADAGNAAPQGGDLDRMP